MSHRLKTLKMNFISLLAKPSHNSNSYNNGNKSNSKPLNSGPGQVSGQSEYNPRNRQNLSPLTISCPYCEKSHCIHTCSGFLNLSPEDRGKFAGSKSLCFNCLVSGHSNTEWRSKKCKKCDRKHNTLLHFESKTITCTASSASNEIWDNNQSHLTNPLSNWEANISTLPTKTTHMQVLIPGQVLLATAVVDALAEDGSKKSATSSTATVVVYFANCLSELVNYSGYQRCSVVTMSCSLWQTALRL